MATWVLVDDSDPQITYGGGWAAFDPSSLNASDADVRLSQDGTVHVLLPNVTTASLTYNFTGSQVALFGTAINFNITKEVNNLNISLPKPEWQCTVDVANLSNGAHTIELNVTKNAGPTGFWFDYLRYQVPADQLNTVPQNATAWFDHTDLRLEFMQKWLPIGSGLMSTSTSESVPFQDPQFFMNFNGSSVAWRALSKVGIELANASLPALSIGSNSTTVNGLWVIDGHTPSGMFTVDLAAETFDDNGNPYSTVLFDTKNFSVTPGPHNLTVYYDGNSTVWPLTLDFLTVLDAFPNVTVDASSGSSTTPADATGAVASGSSKSGTIGGAVGGVLGGLLFLGLGLFLYRHWKVAQRQRKRRTLVNNLEHNNIQLQQFD